MRSSCLTLLDSPDSSGKGGGRPRQCSRRLSARRCCFRFLFQNNCSDLKCLFVLTETCESEYSCVRNWVGHQVLYTALFPCAFQVDASYPGRPFSALNFVRPSFYLHLLGVLSQPRSRTYYIRPDIKTHTTIILLYYVFPCIPSVATANVAAAAAAVCCSTAAVCCNTAVCVLQYCCCCCSCRCRSLLMLFIGWQRNVEKAH